jgi:hypothetical protein
MFQTQQTKDLRWLYLENNESSESRMSSMRKSLINLMRLLLWSIRWSSQEYHWPTKLRTCAMTTTKKVKNFKKPRAQRKWAKWLCKICIICENMVIWVKIWISLLICVKYAQCVKIWSVVWKINFHGIFCEISSMCENMIIWVKIWLSLVICVKYAQCVKIWPFVWKFDFHWIFVWNMLNVWKYGHLSENLIFIGYLCEICSICENMAIWLKNWLSLDICVKCAQCVKIWSFDVLVLFLKTCVQFLMNIILNMANIQFPMKKKETCSKYARLTSEEKETCVTYILYRRKIETRVMGTCLPLLNYTQKNINRIFSTRSSLRQHENGCLNTCTHAHV